MDINLGRSLLQPSNEVIPVLLFFETDEVHARAGDVLFRVLKVIEQSILSPYNALLHVGGRIRETIDRTGLATEKTMQVGANLVGLARTDSVAQSTTPLEDSSTLASVTWRVRHCDSL